MQNLSNTTNLQTEGNNSAHIKQYLQKTIQINLQDKSRIFILKAIAKKARLKLAYNTQLKKLSSKSSLKASSITVDHALKKLLKGTTLQFIVSESGNLVLVPAVKKNNFEDPNAVLQGTVKDAQTGKLLQSANVILKIAGNNQGSKSIGLATDSSGNYQFEGLGPGSYLIRVTYVGYKVQKKKVTLSANEIKTLNFSLQPAIGKLREVKVNAGYYKTSKATSTGTITTISADDIEKEPINNFLDALQGRVPGLQISDNSSIPGAASNVQIRGTNSIASGTTPLFVVDGVPIKVAQDYILTAGYESLDVSSLSELININPSNIQQIDVLKGADATSLYGSRGANGVIIIKTKKGTQTGTHLNINTYTGFKRVGHSLDYLNLNQYENRRREALKNDGITPTKTNSPDLFTWDKSNVSNWQKRFIGQTSGTQHVDASISGGNDDTHFYLGSAYQGDGSVMPGNRYFNRKSLSANVTHSSENNRFSMKLSGAFNQSHVNLNRRDLANYTFLAPDYPLYTANGKPNWTAPQGYPLAYTLQFFDSQTKNYRGNILMDYTPLKGLTLKAHAGFTNDIIGQKLQEPSNSLDPRYNMGAQASVGSYKNNTWIAEPQANYEHAFGNNNVKLLIGGTFQRSKDERESIDGYNFSSDNLLNDITAAGRTSISDGLSEYTYASFFSRLSYDYKKEVLANINFRRDGSSRFGPGKRFGNFSSIGLGWVFSKTNFIQTVLPFLDFGKIHGSYGISGNDNIGNYGYLSTYSFQSGTLSYDGTALTPNGLGNPNYSWEKTKKFEIGLNLTFLDDRLSFDGTVYNDITDNQLIQYSLSPQSGFRSYQANLPATVRNRGFEIQLTSQNIQTHYFNWQTSLNLTKTNNTLKSFDNIQNTSYYNTYVVGKSLNLGQAYIFEGLDHTGLPKFKDVNGDGVINNLDRKVVGDNDPFYGGITNTIAYKGINFSFLIDFKRINKFQTFVRNNGTGQVGNNATTFVLDRWQQPGDENQTNIPRFTTLSSAYSLYDYTNSTLWWRSQNVFRLRNVSLSYSLPQHLLQKFSLQKVRFYIHARNVWVWDKYKKYRFDPVTGNAALPPLRTFTFGINLSL